MQYELYFTDENHIIMQDVRTGSKFLTLDIKSLCGKRIYSGEGYEMEELAPYVTRKAK